MRACKAASDGYTAKAQKGHLDILKTLTDLSPKSVFGAFIRFPLRLVPRNHVASVRSGINKGAQWIVGSSIHGCWLGTYEHDKQALVLELVQPDMIVWDIGANAGFYTLAFARIVGKSGRVYAFEPFAENANNLLRHVHLNGLENTKVIQAALADQSGLAAFSIGKSNAHGRISGKDTSYMVPTFAADDFIARFPKSLPQLIKIDVEGAETAVLSGAAQLLSTCGPDILLALHGEAQGRECREILHSRGYRIYYLDGSAADAGPLRSSEIYARKPRAN
jgi:FkbM family methyltransferase